jgi:putative addiction module killer protein
MQIRESNYYVKWYCGLKDGMAKARIDRRIKRAARGDYGDVKPVGEGVSELRFHFGPGYRVYFKEVGGVMFLLLIGGTKKTQQDDISFAKEIARQI